MIRNLDNRIRIVDGTRLYKVDFNQDNTFGGFSPETLIINNEAFDIAYCSWKNAIILMIDKLHNSNVNINGYLDIKYNDTYSAFTNEESVNTYYCDKIGLYLHANNVTPKMFVACIKKLIELYKIANDQVTIYCRVKHSEESKEVLEYIRNINRTGFINYVTNNVSDKNAQIIIKNLDYVNDAYKFNKVPKNMVARGIDHKIINQDLLCFDKYKIFSAQYSDIEKGVKNVIPAGNAQIVALAVLRHLKEYYKTNPQIY